MTPEEQDKRERMQALINIAIFEGVLLMAVVGVYLYTNRIFYLISGLIGVMLISTPMILRWIRDHGKDLGGRE